MKRKRLNFISFVQNETQTVTKQDHSCPFSWAFNRVPISNILDLPAVPLQTLQQLTSTVTSNREVTRFICVPALPIAIGLCIIYRLVIASLLLMIERPKRGAFGLCSFPALFFTLRSVVLDVALGAWIDCALLNHTLWGWEKSSLSFQF